MTVIDQQQCQEGIGGWDAINLFNQPHVCPCPQPGPGFPTSYVVVFLCSASSIKIRGDCLFC